MQIHILNEQITHAEEIVRRIADGYLAMLENDFFFHAKLNALDVYIDARDEISCFEVYDEGRGCRLELNLSEDTSQREIAALAAHELAHCLMSNMGLGGIRTDRDGAQYMDFGVSWMSETEHSDALEEGMADILADEDVRRVFGAESEKKKSYYEENKFLKQAARELAGCFGISLDRMKKLDHWQYLGKCIRFAHAALDEWRITPAVGCAENEVWYLVTKMSFAQIGVCYDEVMGEGAYRKLCARLQEQYEKRTDPTEDALVRLIRMMGDGTEEDLAERQEILEEIREFRRKKKEIEKQKEQISERAIAADSLREVVERVRRHIGAIKREAEECKISEERTKITQAFERTLHAGRVWKSICAAYALLGELEKAYSDAEFIAKYHIRPIRMMLEDGMEVVQYYGRA